MPGAEAALRLYRMLLSPDAAEGNATQSTTTPSPSGKPDDAMATLVRENADLKRDNADYRKKNRTLREQLATASESKNVPEEVAAELAEYRALGKPGEVGTKLGEAAKLVRERELTAIGEEAGVTKTQTFLKVVAGMSPEDFVRKAETRDGKVVKSVYVKDGDKEVPFDEHFDDLIPSFKPDHLGRDARPVGGTPSRNAPTRRDADREPPIREPEDELRRQPRYAKLG